MKRLIALLLVLVMCIGVFAGCASKKTDATETTGAQQPDASEGADSSKDDPAAKFENKELNIAIFQGGYGADYWNDMVAKFEEAYPGVTVNMTISPTIDELVRPQIVAGNPPDFISLNDTDKGGLIHSLIKERKLLDITDVFDAPGLDGGDKPLRERIVPGMLESTHYSPYGDGKVYLAPFNGGPMGMIYNKTLFEEKGWKLPETWDEFFALGEELEKEENYVEIDGKMQKRALFTYQGIYPAYLEEILFPAFVSSAGNTDVITKMANYEEGSFSSPEVMRVLDMIQSISTKGYLMDGTVALDHTQSQTDMMLGKALFIVNGVWMDNEMKDAPREEGFEFGMMPAPSFNKGDDRYYMTSYEQFSIPADAKNPELAKEFLRFLYTEQSVKAFAEASGSVYSLVDAIDQVSELLPPATANFYKDMAPYKLMLNSWATLPQGCPIVVYDEIFVNCMTPVMNGDMTTEEWAQSVENAFAQIREAQAAAE